MILVCKLLAGHAKLQQLFSSVERGIQMKNMYMYIHAHVLHFVQMFLK